MFADGIDPNSNIRDNIPDYDLVRPNYTNYPIPGGFASSISGNPLFTSNAQNRMTDGPEHCSVGDRDYSKNMQKLFDGNMEVSIRGTPKSSIYRWMFHDVPF